MAFQTSPGINVSEVDLTNATPAVGTTEGAIAGVFRWGPTNERVLISSEQELVARFGAPSSRFTDSAYSTPWTNHETFLTAANFLGYSDALYVTRVSDGGQASAEANTGFTAKYEGELGNSIELSYCLSNGFAAASPDGSTTISVNPNTDTFTAKGFTTSSAAGSIKKGDIISVGGQELEVAESTVTDGDDAEGVTVTERTFESDSAPAKLVLDAGDTGVKLLDSTDESTAYSTNYIQVGSAITGAKRGDPVTYDTLTSGELNNGQLIDGKTYFLLPLVVNEVAITNASLGVDTNTDDKFTIADHGLSTNDYIQYIQGDIAISGLTDGDYYYVVNATTADFQVSLSRGGNAIDIPDTDDQGTITGAKFLHTGDLVGLDASVDTHVYRLAGTYQDAVSGTAINLTAHTSGGDATNKIIHTAQFTVTGTFTRRYTGLNAVTDGAYTTQWGGSSLFDNAPSERKVHIIVKDADGKLTGTAGTVLEVYDNVSIDQGTKKNDGSSNFLPEVLEASSNWIKIAEADTALLTTDNASILNSHSSLALTGGTDGSDENNASIASLAAGYDLYKDESEVDVSFILTGKSRGFALANYIIDNVVEIRRDCIAFVSPEYTDNTAQAIVDFAGNLTASSYVVVDSGYKYQYDKYSDVYRWVPLNGDIAGTCARTDDLRDPWFSPAGYSRGNIKNVVKLLVNPTKAERDLLYKNKVNPVITQPGQGTVLFGDKTFAPVDSAFDRINVRRLFIVLEKTIGKSAKSTLFEFNDEFTRATFVNLVEPFLRDVQGRRGIYDFKVVCDESNNTSQVIDNNQFVGDIYIKPARSINYIQLNFVAVRSGVEFNEIVGAA